MTKRERDASVLKENKGVSLLSKIWGKSGGVGKERNMIKMYYMKTI